MEIWFWRSQAHILGCGGYVWSQPTWVQVLAVTLASSMTLRKPLCLNFYIRKVELLQFLSPRAYVEIQTSQI